MATDSFEAARKKRQQEEERERENREMLSQKGKPGVLKVPGVKQAPDLSIGTMSELFDRMEPLIERLNSLYNQYILGVETRPPIEVRSQLDQLVTKLRNLGKPTPAQQFRFSTLNTSYNMHCDRWDRMCKDLESGKIKRVAGPKKR